jgi:hypothetical protein
LFYVNNGRILEKIKKGENMKIRNGFVSNSSSSSYIVTLKNKTFKEFASNFLAEGDFYDYDPQSLIKKMKLDIEEYKQHDTTKQEWYKDWIKQTEETLNKMEKIYNKKGLCPELLKVIMEKYGIKVTEENNNVVLDYFTSMHNSYNEGISDLMKEIILFCCFENIEATFERIAD